MKPRDQLTEGEIVLLRALVLAGSDGQIPEGPVPPSVDWELMLAVSRRHRLSSLVCEGGLRLAPQTQRPGALQTRLQDDYNLELARAVVRLNLLDDLAEAAPGEPPLALLKGAAFCRTLYRHPALRPMADIDLLVHPQSFEAWGSKLERLGYLPIEITDHAACFRQKASGVYLELHRALTSANSFVGVSTEALLERSVTAPGFETESLRTLSPEDHLFHLCLHSGFQHGFRQAAINAWDAVQLAGSLDAELFLRQARRPRIVGFVYGGLTMCQRVFPTPIFEALLGELRGQLNRRQLRLAAGLRAADLLMPHPGATQGAPWKRFQWASGLGEAFSLAKESIRPAPSAKGELKAPSLRRAFRLFRAHAPRRRSPFVRERWQSFTSPRAVSLGDIRDV